MAKAKAKTARIGSAAKRSFVEEFIALPDKEKDRIAAQFDREFRLEETEPLTPKERRQWDQMVQRDRPLRKGQARVRIRVSLDLEEDFVSRMDKYAHAHGLSRAEVLAKGAKAIVAKAG